MLDVKDYVERFLVAGDQTEHGFGEQAKLYMSLITEETLHETLKELDSNNIIGIADGIADSIWVLEGFRHTIQLDKEFVWDLVKTKYAMESIREHFVRDMSDLKNRDFYAIEIVSSYLQLRGYYIKGDINNITAELQRFYLILCFLAESFGLPLQEIYDEVARSNFSKVSDNGKILKNENGKIMKPVTYTPPNIKAVLGI
jgi:predicted HAD superfamily Cof-like phosphohydrolase